MGDPELTRDQLVALAVQQAALAAEGSFSDRNPALGRMVRCTQCGRRRREHGDPCCNATQLVTVEANKYRTKSRKNNRGW